MKKLLAVTAGAALVVTGLAGFTASAAPGAAPAPAPAPTASLLVQGTLEGPSRASQDGITLRTRGDVTVRDFTLTYPVGATSGWHQHPGIVLATVEQGTVLQRVGCRTYVRTQGESFTEVAPHNITNAVSTGPEETGRAVLRITQIVPAGTTELREDVAPPKCPGHRS